MLPGEWSFHSWGRMHTVGAQLCLFIHSLALRFPISEARGREGIFACGCHTMLGLCDRAEVPWKLVQMGCVWGKSSCST